MKKSKIFLAIFMGMIALAIVSSCNKDEGKNVITQANLTKDDDNNSTAFTSNPSATQLLIVPIPFSNDMFHFPSMASFKAVRDEIGQKPEEYKEYFLWRDLNFSSFDKVSKISSLISDDISESQMNNLLQQFNMTPNSDSEITFKYNSFIRIYS